MDPVDEVDVSIAGRAKHGRVARGFAGMCMRGRIVHPNVSFDFNDAACKALPFQASNQALSE